MISPLYSIFVFLSVIFSFGIKKASFSLSIYIYMDSLEHMHSYSPCMDIGLCIFWADRVTYINFQALGTGFCQFAEPVFQRCMVIIQSQQLAKVMASYITDFFNSICHLDVQILVIAHYLHTKITLDAFICSCKGLYDELSFSKLLNLILF